MAEILQKEHRQKAGVPKAKKASLRVDLTPMVDLGFLLISFFIFTTTISEPTVMKLGMPDDRHITDSSKTEESKTLNLVLGGNNETYVYNGSAINNIKNTGSNRAALRTAVIQKKNEIKNIFGNDSVMVVLIKPTAQSTYENVVNALDEMVICNIKTYILMDANNNESNAVNRK